MSPEIATLVAAAPFLFFWLCLMVLTAALGVVAVMAHWQIEDGDPRWVGWLSVSIAALVAIGAWGASW